MVGHLNSRGANLVSSFNGTGVPGLRSSRARDRRLELSPRHLLQARHCGAGQARRTGSSLLAADPSPSPSAPEAETSPVLAPELQRHTHGASNNSGLWSEELGTGATMGALNYPAKYSLTTTTANCGNDFVVYPTGLAGSATQASIVAYSNLYSGCGGTVPSVYWAYYIGDGNTIQSSPVFSLDGTQLAFVQEEAGEAVFVLLKWALQLLRPLPAQIRSAVTARILAATRLAGQSCTSTTQACSLATPTPPSLLTTPATLRLWETTPAISISSIPYSTALLLRSGRSLASSGESRRAHRSHQPGLRFCVGKRICRGRRWVLVCRQFPNRGRNSVRGAGLFRRFRYSRRTRNRRRPNPRFHRWTGVRIRYERWQRALHGRG